MSGKNLTFKLILDGDSKGLVTAAKQSEDVTKKVFETIRTEAKNVQVDALVSELNKAAKEISNLGDKSTVSASQLRDMSMQSQQMIGALNTELVGAQAELVELSQTKATPSDIQNAVNRVADLKASIQSVEAAFGIYEATATDAMVGVDKAASKTISEVQKFTSVDLTNVVSEAQSATRAIDSMGDGAVVSTKEVERIGNIGTDSINALERELSVATIEFKALTQSSEAVSFEKFNDAKTKVDALEDALTLTKTAFSDFNVKATSAMKSVSDSTDKAADSAKQAGSDIYSSLGIKPPTVINDAITDLSQKLENFKADSKLPAEEITRVTKITEQEIERLKNELNGVEPAAEKANSGVSNLSKGMGGAKFAVNALVGAMAAIGVGLGIRELAETADAYTNLSARINIATSEGGNFTQAMAGVHQVALMTNTSLDATAGLFTKVNDVGKQMGMTQQQSLDLVKTINMAVQTGGGSAQASEAAIVQLTQALQSGVLRGDEFNSIMEQAPGISTALAKSLGVTTGELRKMAENGELSAEKVIKALQDQSAAIETDYAKFPTTIGNALQRIQTQWQILIGTMDQANGASATVAQWLITLADNMGIVETLLGDVGSGFVWIGDQLSFIDISIFESLKSALSSAYDAIKDVVSTLFDFGKTIVDILGTSLTNALAVLSSFTGEATAAGEQVSFLERILQGLSITFGFIADGVTAIKIGVNLLAGAFFDLASAANSVLSAVTWGDVSKQFSANADVMKNKAKQYYAEADKDAVAFESKGMQRLEEAAQTQEEKNAQTLLEAKSLVDQLLLEGQRELDGKKVTEQEKLDAVQAYAEAAIAANNGAMDGVMQADLMTKGYIVTLDEAGKVAIQTWDANVTGAEKAVLSADKARKAAATLKLDLYELKNGVTEAFNSNAKVLNDFANNVEALGLKGEAAGEAVYQAWLKWLETAQSQNEVDLAISKLQEFGKTGQMSAKQVELGMLAVRQVVSQLPADLDPVEQAFERLGIKTKEQLKLAAQLALADFELVRKSGQATQEDLQKAYEETIRLAYASGDAQAIAAANSKAASLGLKIQIDETGKASVASMSGLEQSMNRVRNATSGAEDGFRNLGQTGRDEADSVKSAWEEAVSAASSGMHETRKGTKGKMAKNAEDIEAELKAMGYSDAAAKQHAKDIYEGTKGVNGYKSSGFGFFGGLSNVEQVNAELERMLQYAPNNVSTKAMSGTAKSEPQTTIRIEANGKSVDVQTDASNKDALSEILATLGKVSKAS